MIFIVNIISKYLTKYIYIEDYELFVYGLKSLLRYIIILIPAILMALRFNYSNNFFFFFIHLIILRMNSGGYHFKKQITCLILSFLIVSIGSYIIDKIDFNNGICLIIGLLANFLILKTGPIIKKNNISKELYLYYEKRLKKLLFVYFILMILLYQLNLFIELKTVVLALLITTINLHIKKRRI